MHRRTFLKGLGAVAANGSLLSPLAQAANRVASQTPVKAADADATLIVSIDRTIVWNERTSGKTWFHPRPCLIPSNRGDHQPTVFMTLQEITGSDNFGPVHWTTSADLGRTWREPQPIPAFARGPIEGGLEEAVCDVVPQFHPRTGMVLAIGHNVYYKANGLTKRQEARFPVYALWFADGRWSERKRLRWDDPRGSGIYTCGCSERLVLENGDLLVAISFVRRGETNRRVTSFRCGFNGAELVVKEVGTVLSNPVKRGLLEPSLVRWGGEYLMTIRAEDDRGYLSRSDDGRHWSPPRAWTFADGEPLVMSTTQQHWLQHSDRLHLVYTRKTKDNEKVLRWRAPVFVASVDGTAPSLLRSTERVVFPLDGGDPTHVARMGNFHTLAVSPAESWVVTGEERPASGWKGDLLLARVRWSKPNRLAQWH